MQTLRTLAGVLLTLLMLCGAALADCAVPNGYKRTSSTTWRFTATVPGAPNWERLPSTVPDDISDSVKSLGRMSTGIGIHIKSAADELHLCWDMTAGTASYPSWSQTGVSGIDVYFRSASTGGEWRWLAVGAAPNVAANEITIGLGPSEEREFLIYMPQNRRIVQFRIDVPTAYSVLPGPEPAGAPIVVLGSSIVQGSGTPRAGMAYPQALGRYYNVDTINLGFVGSCQMYEGLATLLATVDASAFYIDCFPNMSPAQITAQMYDFVNILATAHPDVPIYIVQDRLRQGGGPHPVFIQRQHDNEIAALAALGALVQTHQNVFWFPAADLLGHDFEAMVDDSHPSSLGHWRMTENLIALRAAQ